MNIIEFIKSLPTPVLIVSGITIYILIGIVVSFIAGLFDDGNEDFIAIGALWIFALPMIALMGILWLFVAPFKLGAKLSKPKISDEMFIMDNPDWMTLNELKEYYKEEEE